MLKNMAKFAVILLVAAVMAPTLALARGSDDDDNNDGRRGDRQSVGAWVTNEFGVKVGGTQNDSDSNEDSDSKHDEDNNRPEREFKENRGLHLGEFLHKGFMPNLFYNGTVTATSSTGFIIETKDGSTFTVDADSATIVQIPRTVIVLGDVEVGDRVHITGNKTSDSEVNASVVYVLPANLNPAIAKGTVTAVDDNTITVQTKDDTAITVNTDADTTITNSDGETVAQSDIEVGVKTKLLGFWDSVLNVFNAVRIKLF